MGSRGLLHQLFPFHFVVNSFLEVVECGAALRKAFPRFEAGTHLSELVTVEHPFCALEFEQLQQRASKVFRLKVIDHTTILRGQWIPMQTGALGTLAFVGSPWTETMNELSTLSLQLSDFAPHDLTVENLLLRQAQQKQSEDHLRLVKRLEFAAVREAELAETERSLSHDLNLSADMLIRFDKDGTILSATAVNPNLLVTDRPSANIFTDFDSLSRQLKVAVEELHRRREGVISIEFELERCNEKLFFEARIARTKNELFLLVARDVTESRRVASHMAHLANHDRLTNLPNRAYFEQKTSEAIANDEICALLMIDVNKFKSINDCYGHPAGDEVLKAIADRLRSASRTNDVPARLGGDEFALLAEDLPNEETAVLIAERVLNAIMQPMELEQDLTIRPKVSIGIVIPRQDEPIDEVFRKVDLAMYSSKNSSSAYITQFESRMMEEFLDRVTLKQEFDLALARNELRVFYQPIVSLKTGECTACEALVRWQHPRRGLLSPIEFVPLAEETGEIAEMGRQVLRLACRDAKRLQDAGFHLGMSVNVSPLQMREPSFVDEVSTIVDEEQISTSDLMLEITEQTCVEDPAHGQQILEQLNQLGIETAIDDFGVGYSALQYLVRLPTSAVKIDRCFLQALAEKQTQSLKVIQAIVSLAKTLNMKTIAEGIEDESVAEHMRDCGCDLGQGYLYSRPIDFDAFLAWLQERQTNEMRGDQLTAAHS